MSIFIEQLGLNTTDVKNLAMVYAGYAKALLNKEDVNDDILLTSASSFIIGALFESLIAPKKSKILFDLAASLYRRLNIPIWRICILCSGNREFAVNDKIHNDLRNEEELFYIALQDSLQDEKEMHSYYKALVKDINGDIPGLNMPYKLVVKAIEELSDLNKKVIPQSRKYLDDVLQRIAEKLEQYKSDDHWHNLKGPILPFEPVALAIVIVLLQIWKRNNNINDFYDGNDVNKHALVNIAKVMINDY